MAVLHNPKLIGGSFELASYNAVHDALYSRRNVSNIKCVVEQEIKYNPPWDIPDKERIVGKVTVTYDVVLNEEEVI